MAAQVQSPNRIRRLAGPHCPRCDREFDIARLRDGPSTCPSCKRPFDALVGHPPAPVLAAVDGATGDTTECANHEGNVAVDICARCGVFICSLCRMETDEQVLCPPCLEKAAESGEIASLRGELLNYGYLALCFGMGALLVFPLGLTMAIPAWIYALRNQRQNRTLGERIGVVQAPMAMILASLGALACIGFWLAIFLKLRN